MKRRSLLQSIAAIPGIAAARVPETPQQAQFNAETPNLPLTTAAETAAELRRTFSVDQFQALARLGDLLAPAFNGLPGAIEAGAAEFLDFLIGASPEPRQELYKQGLDALNRTARAKHGKMFANLPQEQAATLLMPLKEIGSAVEVAPFLRAAKSDFLQATFNSRPYIDALSQTRRPRNASKYFWYPIT